MYSRNRFQSRLAPGFLGPRVSNKRFPVSGSGTLGFVAERPDLAKRQVVTVAQERFSFCEDDLVDIDPTDIPEGLAVYCPQLDLQGSESRQSTYNSPTFFSRSRSSFARIKSLSRNPSKQFSLKLRRSPEPLESTKPELEAAIHPAAALASTPSHSSPTLVATHVEERRSVDTTPVDDDFSVFYDSDPFRRVESPSEPLGAKSRPASILQVVEEQIVDPNHIISSPPTSCIDTPTTLTPSDAVSSISLNKPFRRSLRRLKTLTKGSLFPPRNPAPEVCQILPSPVPSPSTNREASIHPSNLLPELSFDDTPLSVLIQEDKASETSFDSESTLHPSPHPTARLELDPPPTSSFPLVEYQFVDPSELTASPAATTASGFSVTATPLPPPSPSWLSRNVIELELLARQLQPRLQIEPSSPDPLPILLRSLQVSKSSRDSAVVTPHSVNSSVTLYTPNKRLSQLSVRSTYTPSSSANRLSILRYRQSIAESRKSIQSFITCASLVFAEETDESLDSVPEKPQFFLRLYPPSPEGQRPDITPQSVAVSLSPLEAFDSSNPLIRLPSFSPRLSIENSPDLTPAPERSYEIFIPSQSPFEFDKPSPLPPHLLKLAKAFVRNSTTGMSTYGSKTVDTVDWGDEVDYSDYEWFKDPPPRPEAPAPQPATESYVPQPGVIEQNDMFDYALKSAPNVLFSRFKQYGQLGVLAWCSEFGEMIDAIKHLGFDGNMFVTTRTQALKTCEDILKLDLAIEMQIIVMYLSSQVARLRRFLDHDRVWEDYPTPNFPQDPDLIRLGPT